MEQQQEIQTSALMQQVESLLPKMNFYRFCQLLEQITSNKHTIGITDSPVSDPIRFAPTVERSFPAGELKCIERSDYSERPATVRTRFLGLYGVDSNLPSILSDDISMQMDGYEGITDFLDIFNHRILTQFYRIWLKYHYPASFLYGGEDPVSKCLIGLTGLGIKGTEVQIESPTSRFLALLGLITQRTRPAEGIEGMIRIVVPNCQVSVQEFYPIWVSVTERSRLLERQTQLDGSSILGRHFRDSTQTVRIRITPNSHDDIISFLPDGQFYQDIMALLRFYLGYRVDAQLELKIERNNMPITRLRTTRSRLGQTSSLINPFAKDNPKEDIIVKVGTYQGIN